VAEKNTQNAELFDRLLNDRLSREDIESLIQWLGSEEASPESKELVLGQLKKAVNPAELSPDILARLEARLPLILSENKQSSPIISIFRKKWLRYAAAIVILLGTGLYFLATPKQTIQEKPAIAKLPVADIEPGKQGAVLTLVDGSKMVLDSLGNGIVATQNGTKVLLQNGQLVYEAGNPAEAIVGYNTMATPKGRQFQLSLPDGSKVWLNAASSIKYPTIFTGNERKVEVTGEAYFEVVKNPSSPFRVKINEETEIEVLGTHFNVNSYKNEESINTTLLEGSVLVKNGTGKLVLKQGQQARVAENEKIKLVEDVDVEKVMAWKNGVFNFQDATLEEVMRQLERWYDIEIVYEKNIPKLEFYGKMGKDLSLQTVLRGLEKSNVHFRIEEGNRLVVLP
jgi:transmembrane sensor